jgi:hypothetical protein
MPSLDGQLLYACIEQLEITQLQLLKLLRTEDVQVDGVQNERFNMQLREIKNSAESLAARVQLAMYRAGVDRRVVNRRGNGKSKDS